MRRDDRFDLLSEVDRAIASATMRSSGATPWSP
jgi:hypothetical protein